ncbi:hypothetical protein [Parasphingorhabdus pacifica]
MAGEPGVGDVAVEALTPAGEVEESALGDAGFGSAPGAVGVAFTAEGAC